MSADLGSSLTSIDWLPRLALERPRRQGSAAGTDRKPPHSYASLIALAIGSSPTRRMTLSEIYAWIAEAFPYYQRVGTGWKNSIRHNLSLNKCFRKIPRSKDTPGKGSYWTVDSNLKDDAPSPRPMKRIHKPDELDLYSAQTEHRKIPRVTQSSRQEELQEDRTGESQVPSDSQTRTLDNCAPCLRGSQSQSQTVFPFPELNFEDLNHSFRGLCRSILDQSSGREGFGNSGGEGFAPLHTPTVSCSPLFTFALPQQARNLRTSAGPASPSSQTPRSNTQSSSCGPCQGEGTHERGQEALTGNCEPVLPADWISCSDTLKAGLELASQLDWRNIDISQFPGLTENLQPTSSDPSPLDRNQFWGLCCSLNHIFLQRGLIQPQAPAHTSDEGPRNDTGIAVAPGHRLLNPSDIQDEFDWDSIV
ncbi:forkhead box protein J2-like [Heterodontus francisci]|uniref:forkhead box protein J2-like n=1 Tax=Heterodontus francisci TaxID=7792 RepID=UPI00355C8925